MRACSARCRPPAPAKHEFRRFGQRCVTHLSDPTASIFATTHAVLIPSYNTGEGLLDTVAVVRRLGWPVCGVIDGSTDGSGERLARHAARDPDLHVCMVPHNRGKGAAILHGLAHICAHGITHVVTLDADGQHESGDIAMLVTLSRTAPDAMVLGMPEFDASAPPIRVAGHQVSKFWANLVTLRSGIGNPLFGFRVYPVAPLLRAFAETRWMQRFDFDSEAAIRMACHGVATIDVPMPVRYVRRADGGVSHFHYLRDNLLLAFMYVRLSAALLPRLPRLLARRFKSCRR
jgi:glycosyltransferase involved in cell wall biosynthesis